MFMTFVVSGFTIVVHHDQANRPDRPYSLSSGGGSVKILTSTHAVSDVHVVKFLSGEGFRSKTAMHYLGYSVFSIATAAVLHCISPQLRAERSSSSLVAEASSSPLSKDLLFHCFRM